MTPIVRPQDDGIHLRIANTTRHEMEFEYDVDHGDGGGGGAVIAPGVSDQVVPFVARSIDVTCYRNETVAVGADYETIGVEDPANVAKSPDLECRRVVHIRDVDLRWSGPDVVQTARAYLRARGLLRSRDRIERAVAPGPEFPIVRVVRGEHTAASLEFTETHRNRFSLMYVDLCAEFASR